MSEGNSRSRESPIRRGEILFRYVDKIGFKLASFYLEFYDRRNFDFRKGASTYLALRKLFLADGMSAEEFDTMISDLTE